MPPTHVYNIWEQDEYLSRPITVSCFLPTGIFIQLTCKPEDTIFNIKTETWKQAKNYPLFKQMLDINFYMFQCVNQNAEQEDIFDEKRRLCDIQPFFPVLRLVLKADDVEDKILNGHISHVIDKGLHEFDMMENEEVNDFRLKMQHLSYVLQRERTHWDWDKKACFLFPPQLESALNLSESIRRRLKDRQPIEFKMRFLDNPLRITVLQADPYEYPTDLVKKAIAAVYTLRGSKVEDYVLKIRGKLEFLLSHRPLCEYQYIREMVSKSRKENQRPELVLVKKTTLRVNELLMDPLTSKMSMKKKEQNPPPAPPRARANVRYSDDVHEKVRFTIHRASNVNVDNSNNLIVRVRAGIFHGGEQLGDCFMTSTETSGSNPEWNESFESLITVSNLPRMARLCLMIGTTTRRQAKKNPIPLAWVNTTFFNYKNHLQTGKIVLDMWPALEGVDLNPLGSVESNPTHRYREATAIEISFGNYPGDDILYPSLDRLVDKANAYQKEYLELDYLESVNRDPSEELRSIVEKDPLDDLEMQEKEILWKARQECCEHVPHSLPRLLQCVQWDNSASVAQMLTLLQTWPELKPEEAIELLDYKYADIAVRRFAVLCLENLTDSQLSQYLLQLVQALKYETHLYCDLGEFLLRRAIKNQRIGHFFFWHLRAEMHNPAVSTRFGLLLEGYCRCNIVHMRILKKQVESLGKMQLVNEQIKSRLGTSKREDLVVMMSKILHDETDAGTLKEFVSPLSPAHRLDKPRIKECKFMSSKMAPLYLVFKNEDPIGDDVKIMFKNGDDLRQDMLTLQALQIMDNIWKEEGLDLRLIPYKALSTGDCSGLIEIVTEAETIAKIQTKKGKGGRIGAAFHVASLLEWLKEKNVTQVELDRAIEDFTYSCAGYCVATYVLGIGDRHNDNIMIKETGQLFHIDFGHFLGKFKSKWGVKRERVPFVLTHDFVHVITRGNRKEATKAFEEISCEKAFMILRRHGNLLITLFAMMLSSGIPELSDSTIYYLRGSLVLEKSDEEALRHFRTKFNEALQQSWKTSVNWMMHHMAH